MSKLVLIKLATSHEKPAERPVTSIRWGGIHREASASEPLPSGPPFEPHPAPRDVPNWMPPDYYI